MKKFFISIILLFCATAVYSQVENDRTLSSSYQDKNFICSMSVKIRPYKLTDTVGAKLYIKNTGKIPIYIEKTRNDSVLEYSEHNYFDGFFSYKIFGELDYLEIMTHFHYDLYLTEVKPGEERSYKLFIPLILEKGWKGEFPYKHALHTLNFPERLAIEMNFGYVPKVSSSVPIISKDGRFNHSYEEWLEWKVKQFTLGPIYVGLELE